VIGARGVLDFAGSLIELVAVDYVERISGVTERELLSGVLVNFLLLDRLNTEELGEVVGRIAVTVERAGLSVGKNRAAVIDDPIDNLLLNIAGM
jgi:hypothetical protein